jgi:hypothetical protein
MFEPDRGLAVLVDVGQQPASSSLLLEGIEDYDISPVSRKL